MAAENCEKNPSKMSHIFSTEPLSNNSQVETGWHLDEQSIDDDLMNHNMTWQCAGRQSEAIITILASNRGHLKKKQQSRQI